MLIPMNSLVLVPFVLIAQHENKLPKYSVHLSAASEIDSKMVTVVLENELKQIDDFLGLKNKTTLKVRSIDYESKTYYLFFNANQKEVVAFVVSDIPTVDAVGEDRIVNRAFGALKNGSWVLSHVRKGKRFESQGGVSTYADIRTAISKGVNQTDLGFVSFHR